MFIWPRVTFVLSTGYALRAILRIPFTLFLVPPHGASWVAKPRASEVPNLCLDVLVEGTAALELTENNTPILLTSLTPESVLVAPVKVSSKGK